MGFDGVAALLNETLEEEKVTDASLTELAGEEINPAAAQSDSADEE
ncbi:MAG: hypothetical protein H7Z43_06915 [Clostridia bacterium]|nr:hypothetical protein [Deltaproteobacteria bacterium]